MADIHELCFTLYRSLYRIKISPYPFSGSFMPMDTHVGWRGGESFCCSPCYTFPYMLIHWNSFWKICIFPLLLWSFRHWLNFWMQSYKVKQLWWSRRLLFRNIPGLFFFGPIPLGGTLLCSSFTSRFLPVVVPVMNAKELPQKKTGTLRTMYV